MNEKNEFKMTQDVNGKESSKRIWAGRYLTLGLFMALAWFVLLSVVQITGTELKVEFPWQIWIGILGLGGSLLGVTIFESKNK